MVSPGGEREEWRFNPAFVRLEQVLRGGFGALRLAWVSRGETVEMAARLGPAGQNGFCRRSFLGTRRGPPGASVFLTSDGRRQRRSIQKTGRPWGARAAGPEIRLHADYLALDKRATDAGRGAEASNSAI
ncbi:MAG: DUF2244 domain-containing protein [Beijerinckiaceae bacterium]|nr:DUF2244 domain-containing protein [Beijerinckiaceae bacterium]